MTESVISMLGFLEERPRTVREVAAHLKIKPELARSRLRTQSIYFRVAMPGQRTKADGQYTLTYRGKIDLDAAKGKRERDKRRKGGGGVSALSKEGERGREGEGETYYVCAEALDDKVVLRIEDMKATFGFSTADKLSRQLMLAAAAVRKHAREGSPAEFARTLSINDHIGLITEELAWWQERKEKAFSNAGHGSHARITEDTEQMIPRIMDSLARMSRILLAQPESSGIHRAIEQAPRDPEAEFARRLMTGAQVTTGVVHAPLSPAAERMMRQPTPKPDTELTPPIL